MFINGATPVPAMRRVSIFNKCSSTNVLRYQEPLLTIINSFNTINTSVMPTPNATPGGNLRCDKCYYNHKRCETTVPGNGCDNCAGKDCKFFSPRFALFDGYISICMLLW